MAIDLVTKIFSKQIFSLSSFNLGKISTESWSILDVKIRLSAKIFKNQREDGTYIVDGRVILPTEITISLIIQTKSDLDKINQILQDRSTIYTITTRGLSFESMVLHSDNISQDSDNISSQPSQLIFRQLLTQQGKLPTVRQAADSSVIDKGIAYLKETANTVQSVGAKIANGIGSLF